MTISRYLNVFPFSATSSPFLITRSLLPRTSNGFFANITKAYRTPATKVREGVVDIKLLWMNARVRNLLFNKIKNQETVENENHEHYISYVKKTSDLHLSLRA